ncbi:MAG: GNAT family N-acetyltransferase [Bacilli bacterium]|nr:GNAT family N-acetyltransferase [Bacilli bacterium]
MIRKGTIADWPIITEYNIAMAWETEKKVLDCNTVTEGVKAILADSTKGYYYVYEVDSQTVGQLMVTYEWSDWRNGYFWWIQSVYVAPQHRHKGIYKQLYQEVRAQAAKQKDVCGIRLYVEKHNIRAQKTYQSLGMEETDYLVYEELFKILN